MDLIKTLELAGGAARRGRLLKTGCSEHDLRAAVASGRVWLAAPGVFALPQAGPDTVLAARLNAQLTCVSALQAAGLPVSRLPRCTHLAVPDSFTRRGRDLEGARLHYSTAARSEGLAVPVAAALDAAGACLGDIWHLVAVDAALNSGLITHGSVLDFRRTPKERREFLLRFADGRSQSPGETIARLRLVQAGFRVRPQAYVEGAGLVDMVVNDVLILQVDGYEPHSSKSSFRRDREKSRAVIKAGRPQLTYAASELLGEWEAPVVRDVRQALAEWAARGPAAARPSYP